MSQVEAAAYALAEGPGAWLLQDALDRRNCPLPQPGPILWQLGTGIRAPGEARLHQSCHRLDHGVRRKRPVRSRVL